MSARVITSLITTATATGTLAQSSNAGEPTLPTMSVAGSALLGINGNDVQGDTFQSDATYRCFHTSPIL
ncbi:MAG TPA: hypothetical protein VJ577_00915 [Burkholderiaceae bacterium]|nr:hypothetical protein [Burkholderiaceae bacterium]